jgi:hypothetical protein
MSEFWKCNICDDETTDTRHAAYPLLDKDKPCCGLCFQEDVVPFIKDLQNSVIWEHVKGKMQVYVDSAQQNNNKLGNHKCTICSGWFDEHPNSAYPINDMGEVCCDSCHKHTVIPYRESFHAAECDAPTIEKDSPILPLKLEEPEFELMLNEIGLTIINNNHNN